MHYGRADGMFSSLERGFLGIEVQTYIESHQPDPFKKGPQNLSSSPRGNDRHRSLIYSIIARRRGGDHSQPSFWIRWKFPMDKGLEKMKIIKIPRTKRGREVPNKNAEIFYYTLAVTSSKF